MGSLFSENRNITNFQFLDNLTFMNFKCGYDFVVAIAVPGMHNESEIAKSHTKQLVRSSTQSNLAGSKSASKVSKPMIYKKRLPSETF